MKKILILILTACLFAACSDDDDEKETQTIVSDAKLIPREIISYKDFNIISILTFKYDKDNRLEKIYEDRDEYLKYTYNLIYDKAGKIDSLIISRNYSQPEEYNFIYTDNKVTVDVEGYYIEKNYFLDSEGFVEYIYSHGDDSKEIYKYSDNRNIINVFDVESTIISYDKYNGLFKYLGIPQWLYLANLLPISPWKYNYNNNETERTSSYLNSYFSLLYNDEDYPVRIEEKREYLRTGSLETNHYTYLISYQEIKE